MTRDEAAAVYGRLHKQLLAEMHDQLLDQGFDPDLAAAFTDVLQMAGKPEACRFYGRSQEYQLAVDAGIVEPTVFGFQNNSSRSQYLRWDLENAVLRDPEYKAHFWTPKGRVMCHEEGDGGPLWWLGREDAQALINSEYMGEAVVLPRLPAGLYWQVSWDICLFVAHPCSIQAEYQGLAPPTKYIPFIYA